LDVCLSYTDGEVSGQLARDVLGTAGRSAMFDFADALIDGDAGRALQQIDQVMRRGSDPQVFIRDTSQHLRGILLAGAVGEGIAEIMEITPEDAEHFREQAKRIQPQALQRMLELFMRAEPDTRWASRPRTILELAAVRACRPDQEADASMSERLSRVEQLLVTGAAPTRPPAAPAAPKVEKKPAAPPPPPASVPEGPPPQPYLDAIKRLGEENPSIRAPLGSMRFMSFDGQTVTVEFSKKQMMHLRLLERKKPLFDQALTEAFGSPVSIAMRQEGSAPEKKLSDVARDVINQSYDVFGRDKIEIVD